MALKAPSLSPLDSVKMLGRQWTSGQPGTLLPLHWGTRVTTTQGSCILSSGLSLCLPPVQPCNKAVGQTVGHEYLESFPYCTNLMRLLNRPFQVRTCVWGQQSLISKFLFSEVEPPGYTCTLNTSHVGSYVEGCTVHCFLESYNLYCTLCLGISKCFLRISHSRCSMHTCHL